jgi:PAS domain S-box-containing protein
MLSWRWGAYLLAILITSLAITLHLQKVSLGGMQPAAVLLLVPIILSALAGGLGPGLSSTIMVAFLAKFFIIAPLRQFRFDRSSDFIQWLALLISGVVLSIVIEVRQKATRKPRNPEPEDRSPAIERKVQAGFLLGLVLLLIIGLISYLSVNQLRTNADSERRSDQFIEAIRQVLEGTEKLAIVRERIRDNAREDDIDLAGRIRTAVSESLTKLETYPFLDSQQENRIQLLSAAVRTELESARAVMEGDSTVERPAGSPGSESPARASLLFQQLCRDLETSEWKVRRQRHDEARNDFALAKTVIGIGSALAIAFVTIALLLLRQGFAASRRAESALREARDQLEARVQKRTAELARSIGSLYASESRLAEAQKISHTGSYDWELRTSQLTWSDELYRIFGIESTKPATLEAMERMVHPDDYPRVHEIFVRARDGEVPESVEYRIVRRNREVRHLLANARGIRDERHSVVRIVGTIQDITERKRAEELIRLQQEHSHSLLRLSRNLERALTQADVLSACREEVERTLGLRAVWFYLFADDRKTVRLVHADFGPVNPPPMTPGQPIRVEGDRLLEELASAHSLVVVKDARIDPRMNRAMVENQGCRTLINMPIMLAGRRLGAIGAGTFGQEGVRDLSAAEADFFAAAASHAAVVLDRVMASLERHRAEKALRESEERLQLASRVGGVGIFEHNFASGEVFASPLLLQITDMAEGENVLAGLMERILPDDGPALLACVGPNPDPEHDGRAELECRLRVPGGGIRWLRLQAQTWFEGDGNNRRPVRTIGTVIDITPQKLSQAALERHAALLDLARDGIIVRDESSRVIFWSRGAVELYGYTSEEAAGLVPQKLLNTVFPQPLEEIQQQLASSGHWEGELIQTCKDGRKLIVTSQWALQRGQVGAPAAILEVNRDITESKRLEEARERLAAIVESSDDAIIGKTLDGIISSWNRGAQQIFGYTAEEAVGKSIQMLIPPERAGEEPEILARIRRGISVEHFETVRVRKDGMRINTSATISPVRDGRGQIIGASQVSRDITERKQAEAALRASIKENSDLRAALDEHAIVAITDPHGRITFVNDKFCAISKYSYAELVGQDHRIVNSGHHSKEFVRDLWTTISQGRVWQGEIKNKAKDGSFFWVATTIVPFLDEQGEPRQYVAIRADITERKRAEEQLRQAQRMESIGTLAGGIAHDFNNILSAILGNAELARLDTEPEHKAYHSIEEIKKAGLRAKGLVQQILTFGRQQPSERKVVALGAVIEETVSLMRATLPAGVQIISAIAPDAPNVLADSGQVHQVLVNLCTNAWHAMEEQPGRIDITLSGVTFDTATAADVSSIRPGRYACITVSDTGKGIEPAILKRIFEPFFTTKAPGKGTGLGLPVVHGIMQSHGGAINVVSELGNGTTFTLYFPAVADAVEADAPPEQPTRGGQGQCILYLDDEEQLVSLTTRMLTRLGYRIIGFTDPIEAVEAFRQTPDKFDLVVTDYSMPELSGLQVAANLLQIRPEALVILCSGYLTEELRQKAGEVGICHVIYKPNTVEELSKSIQELILEARLTPGPAATP